MNKEVSERERLTDSRVRKKKRGGEKRDIEGER